MLKLIACYKFEQCVFLLFAFNWRPLHVSLIRNIGWRLGLQAVTGVVFISFFLGVCYRSASLYHPQRRAILHLKNQKKKVKEKKGHVTTEKPPFFDFSPLRIRTVQILLMSSATGAVGLYTPIFYLVSFATFI
jgi:hypothetical protein